MASSEHSGTPDVGSTFGNGTLKVATCVIGVNYQPGLHIRIYTKEYGWMVLTCGPYYGLSRSVGSYCLST